MGNPTFMYRVKDGELESQVFDADKIPRGWFDSPQKAQEKPKRKVETNGYSE